MNFYVDFFCQLRQKKLILLLNSVLNGSKRVLILLISLFFSDIIAYSQFNSLDMLSAVLDWERANPSLVASNKRTNVLGEFQSQWVGFEGHPQDVFFSFNSESKWKSGGYFNGCPSRQNTGRQGIESGYNYKANSYAIVQGVTGHGVDTSGNQFRKITAVTSPSMLYNFHDSETFQTYKSNYFFANELDSSKKNFVDFRHANGKSANFVYVDGHTETNNDKVKFRFSNETTALAEYPEVYARFVFK